MKDQLFHRIKSIKVSGGFLMGLDLALDDGLNCLIGPRGTGKSSVQELIRYALNSMPGREGDPLRKRIQSLIDSNLNGGRVELSIETKEGLTYTVSRASGEDAILLDEEGNPLQAAPQLFRADIYSQNEIESIAETPHYQLDLIDKFEEDRMREINAQIAKSIRELEANASHILPLVAERATLEGELTQLDAVREKLRGLARIEGADSEAFNRAHVLKALRDRELTALDHSRDTLRDFAVMIRDLLGNSEAEATSFFEEDMMSGPNGKLLASTVAVVRDAANFAEQRLKEAADHLEQTDTAIAEKRVGLEKVHAMQELSFRKLIERQQQNQAQSAERAKLEKQQNELLFKQRRLKDIVEQIKAHTNQRQLLLAKLSDERDRRFAIRDSVAKMLNARLMPYIRVGVDQSADQEAFRRCLESNLRGAQIRHISVASAISAAMSPHELGDMVRRGIAGALAKSASINPQQASMVLKVLASPEKLMELEILDQDDAPSIELCDNGIYKNAAELSTGQKCTAILPILMFESANPLLIDQPEDNLDNRYVYETVVASVNKVKETRQLIFVTHNPNIPVLGDAAHVIVMQSDGRTASPKRIGNVDDCRDEIVSLLEGGAEAFRLRSEKYEFHSR